ncbi:lactonase family protein [Reichenbachiella versicolor]|uniref:lactonase family protein n=1 Tax=Reichenbachiella versicolor TaxID=1821036 RepID=UPI000D6DF1B2|nr:beta-propeller fold lactonase family protein [Reichenbachiella versicolor]
MKIIVGSYTEKLSEEIIGEGDGISIFEFNQEKLELTLLSKQQQRNPAYLALSEDKKYLYAAEELFEQSAPMLFSYKINNGSALEITDQKLIVGSLACHANIHEGNLLIANYGSGNVIIQGVLDGQFVGKRNMIQHQGKSVNQFRQESPHAHMTCFVNEEKFYVPDLGLDRCVAYKLVEGVVFALPEDDLVLPEGEGPRHMVLSDDGVYVYVVSELTGRVSVFDAESKELLQQVESIPKYFKGTPSSAAIRMHPNGHYLYVANREINMLTIYEMLEDGLIRLLTYTYLVDKTPREFNISSDGKYLIVLGQDSHTLSFYSIEENGGIELLKTFGGIKSPSCLLFLD